MARAALEHDVDTLLLDDCWNRIGTRGDSSCPRLAEYIRCAECPVFEQAAATLLECMSGDLREAQEREREREREQEQAPPANAVATEAAFAFRLGHEWLALPAAVIDHIGEVRPIHSLPHRRDPVVLGLVNVRGTLTIAASLAALLNIKGPHALRNASRNPYARMLVASHGSESAAFPVDEAEGIVRYRASDLMAIPATLAHAAASHARGLIAWHDTTVGLLDAERVFDSLARSLR